MALHGSAPHRQAWDSSVCLQHTRRDKEKKVRDVGGILTVTTTSQLFSIGNISKVQMFDIMGGRIETQVGSFCKLILRKAF